MSEAFDLREACTQYIGSPVVATSHLEDGQANESHQVEPLHGDRIVVRVLKMTTPNAPCTRSRSSTVPDA
jgi:hypothetical protein